jgi:hypothetical protein
MILAALTYSRARLKVLGRTEWTDPSFVNIPRPRLGTSFHVTQEPVPGISNNQDNQIMNVPITVRLPFAPNRKPTDLMDAATQFADTVIADFIDPKHRLTQTNLKTVYFNTMALDPLDDSNDNGVIVRLLFTMLVVTSTR